MSNPENHVFSFKLQIFPVLQIGDVNFKAYLLIVQLPI